jgi:hypothetical protein
MMAATLKMAPPPPPVLTADVAPRMTPIHEDSRLVEVRRRAAKAVALCETAVQRRKTLQRVLDEPGAPGLARMEAERDLPAARVAEREAEIGLLTAQAEEKAVRAQVVTEIKTAARPRIRAALDRLNARLEAAKQANDDLASTLAEVQDALGPSWDGFGTEGVCHYFVPAHHGTESQHAYRLRWLAEQGWA